MRAKGVRMDYTGPDAADFADVAALNHAFLVRLRSPGMAGERLREHLPEPLSLLRGLREVLPRDGPTVLYFEVPAAEWAFARRGVWDLIYRRRP